MKHSGRGRIAGRAVVLAVVLGGVAGCAARGMGGAEPAAEEAPEIRVRDFPASTDVVGWEEAHYGLRAQVGRDGELEPFLERGDHRLYMAPLYARGMGGFAHAAAPEGLLLRTGRATRDAHACYGGGRCSPVETIGFSIPDSVVRANRDGLVVTFYPRAGANWTVTFRRELLDPYLQAVDSVAAVRRSARARQSTASAATR